MQRGPSILLVMSLSFLLPLLCFSSLNAQEVEKEAAIIFKYVDMPSDVLLNPPLLSMVIAGDVPPWKDIGAVDVVLSSAPSVVSGRAFKTAIRSVKVKTLHNGKDIFIMLNWTDGTMNAKESSSTFADGAAVQLPLVIGPILPNYIKGQQDAYVNITYWRADRKKPDNIVANGIGTVAVTNTKGENLSANGYWKLGQWTVIISRPLKTGSDNQTQLARGTETFIAFAVWDGEGNQRDGHKSVSFWQTLRLE